MGASILSGDNSTVPRAEFRLRILFLIPEDLARTFDASYLSTPSGSALCGTLIRWSICSWPVYTRRLWSCSFGTIMLRRRIGTGRSKEELLAEYSGRYQY